jgi:hypothetical protein
MASQHVLEARRVKAAQETAETLKEVNRKIDLIMKHLGIQDVADVVLPEAAEGDHEPEPEQVEGEPEGEPEAKKKRK